MIQLNITDSKYPKALRNIKNPPKQLFLLGNSDLLNSYSVAIVGARNASLNGKQLSAKFSLELSMSGITIISGLATGIDTVAHSYSYDKCGKTIAVLGCGFNHIFPKENLGLYSKILENDGLIISEYPPSEEASPNYFLQRNRIITGLSLGLLVVEAFYRSGTSVTAKLAKEQGKKVFALPHEIWDKRGVGTNRLLKNGATLVTDTSDILHNLKLNREKLNFLYLKKKGVFDNIPYNFDSPKVTFKDQKLDNIFNLISKNPTSANFLAKETGYSINEVLSVLFMLEIDGYIKKVQGGFVCS